MTKTSMNHGELVARIEHLVREYVSTIRIAAQAAVERAVVGNVAASAKKRAPLAVPASRQGARRRSDEIGALGERFFDALSRSPGETMTVLAPLVGSTARELSRPVLVLKRAGRIRSVGTKHATRYFPMASRSSA